MIVAYDSDLDNNEAFRYLKLKLAPSGMSVKWIWIQGITIKPLLSAELGRSIL